MALRTLALQHEEIHSLSLEDCFSGHSARSKADYYPECLFLSLISHTLDPERRHPTGSSAPATKKSMWQRFRNRVSTRSTQLDPEVHSANDLHGEDETPADDLMTEGLSEPHQSQGWHPSAAQRALEALSDPFRLALCKIHLSVFLLHDGTLISV